MGLKLGVGVVVVALLGTVAWLHGLLSSQQAQLGRMASRIDALEEQLEEATVPAARDVALPALRGTASPGQTAPAAARLEVDDAMRTRLREAPARNGSPPSEPEQEVRDALLDVLATEDPELREGFRNLVREEQRVLRDEWRQRRQARWEEQTSQRLASFGKEHGLSSEQQDALFAILTAARDRIGEAFRQRRESDDPASPESMRELAQTIRGEADSEVKELLDQKQYEAYEQLREDGELFGGGPGRRRGRAPEPGPP